MRSVLKVLARRIMPQTSYPFDSSSSARYEPSCPVIPVTSALRPILSGQRGIDAPPCDGFLIMFREPRERGADPVLESDRRAPSERGDAAHVEELARHAVRLRRVELQRHARRDDAADQLPELADRDVRADADVERDLAFVVAQEEDARVGEIVDMEELAAGRAGAPDRHAVRRL